VPIRIDQGSEGRRPARAECGVDRGAESEHSITFTHQRRYLSTPSKLPPVPSATWTGYAPNLDQKSTSAIIPTYTNWPSPHQVFCFFLRGATWARVPYRYVITLVLPPFSADVSFCRRFAMQTHPHEPDAHAPIHRSRRRHLLILLVPTRSTTHRYFFNAVETAPCVTRARLTGLHADSLNMRLQ
jgi:hypothetical protein